VSKNQEGGWKLNEGRGRRVRPGVRTGTGTGGTTKSLKKDREKENSVSGEVAKFRRGTQSNLPRRERENWREKRNKIAR